jgi:diguanylate cyclase (GGDEF)-like protein
MSEQILVFGDVAADIQLIKQAMVPQGFVVEAVPYKKTTNPTIDIGACAVILADYNMVGRGVKDIVGKIQTNRLKTCFILYGDEIDTAEVTDLLQNGIYGFVPRSQLAGRVANMVISGLENRQSFIEILEMIDALKQANDRLEVEKGARQDQNRQLAFINRLSVMLSRDQSWGRVIPNLLEAGFLNVCDTELLSIFYSLGGKWHMAVHLSNAAISKSAIEELKKEMAGQFGTDAGQHIDPKEITLHLSPFSVKISGPDSFSAAQCMSFPLNLAGKQFGLLFFKPQKGTRSVEQQRTLVSTVSNILALSLKNAQIRHRLHTLAITDGLTGLYNAKGLNDTLEYEFTRAQRYSQPMALTMIDVDDFNTINDMLGHATGDYVLTEMAACIRRCARRTDTVARYENDEFAILMPETSIEKAAAFAFRLMRIVKQHDFKWQGADVNVKFSYGIAAIDSTEALGSTIGDMIVQARLKLHGTRKARRQLYPVAGGR